MKKHLLKIAVFLTMLLIWGCSLDSDDVLFDETTENYQLYDYYVDENGNEGIVVHIEDNEYSGCIIVMSADEACLPWGHIGEVVYQGTDTFRFPAHSYGDDSFGLAMLNLTKSKGVEKYPAMAWCDQKNKKVLPSSSSWRLPTRRELIDIWGIGNKKDLDKFNSALSDIGGVIVNIENYYWTCNEDYEDYFEDVIDKDLEQVADPLNNAIARQPLSWDKECRLKKSYNYVRAIKYIYRKGCY